MRIGRRNKAVSTLQVRGFRVTLEHSNHSPGLFTRSFDKVKRSLFLICFIIAGLGIIAGLPVLIGPGTIGFCLVALVHLFMRRSSTPLLGNYLGMGRYLRLTREGKILLVLTLTIGLTAFNARINLLLIVLGMLLGVITISGILSENSLRRLRARVFLPSTAFAGTDFPVRLSVRNGKKRLPSYSVTVDVLLEDKKGAHSTSSYVLKLPADQMVTLEQLINIDTRGRKTVQGVRISTRFPFGFFEKWSYCKTSAEVLLFPKLGRMLRRMVPSSDEYRHQGSRKVLTKIGRDEFWGIREYREGDDPSHIHWRSSARLGKRLVMEFHQQESQNVCILLDAFVPPDSPELEERFELAISFAATLAKHLVDRDLRVSFAACGQELVKLAANPGGRQARRIFTALAEIESNSEFNFNHLVNELDPRMITDTFVIAVLLDDERRNMAQANLHHHPGRPVNIISVDDPSFSTLFVPPEPDDAGTDSLPSTTAEEEASVS